MKWSRYIVVVTVSLFVTIGFTKHTYAQGNVTVHSDPRLSLLVKKPHNTEQASASVPVRKPVKRTSPDAAVPVKSNTPQPATAKVVKEPRRPTTNIVGKNGQQPAVFVPARTSHHGGSVYSGKGFRVQIYNGADRNKAIQVKADFMRQFPGVRTYLTYVSPCFRVKVGDYRSRAEAEGMLREANSIYNPSMIVPDVVRISTF